MTKKPAAIVLLLSLSLQAGCRTMPARPAPAPASSNHNLLIISLANVSASRMSLYGYARKTTPKLDEWARQAWVFEQASTHASWTLPVGVSLFTGLYPYSHKIMIRDLENVLPPEVETLPEALRDAGWKTAAFTGGLDYYPGFSHMRGFRTAPDNPNFTGFRTTLAQAKEWLAENGDHKFMVFIHGYDTHCPFTPSRGFAGTFSGGRGKDVSVTTGLCAWGTQTGPDEFRASYFHDCADVENSSHMCGAWQKNDVRLTMNDVRNLSDLYDEKILETDSLVGDFLASLDKEAKEKTIIVIFSEHGEMSARHGQFGRAGAARGTHYDDILHVPLLIRFPGAPGRRVSGLTQLIDVMPTLLEALRLPIPQQVQGVDLAPLAKDGTSVNEYAFAATNYNILPNLTESVRDLRWKLIREFSAGRFGPKADAPPKPPSETVELYDLAEDPDELHNLAEARADVVRRLQARLALWAAQTKAANPKRPRTQELPGSLLPAARQRGYW
ncbi:MAG: sulfatase-like hydrolase/transferase [Elusimicrobia bacterium]|nr:sulfatase-like hydrolase/transferase [Elusimicrobiota bacterium]